MRELAHARVDKEIDEEAEVDCELSQLDQGQILLPPEVLPVLWPKAGQEVIAVHDDMHNRVLGGAKNTIATRGKVGSKPKDERHRGVMVNV